MSHLKPDALPEKILVADDEEALSDLVRFKLENAGYRVICRLDGQAALEAVRVESPDLVILDLAMPGLTGFEVLERLKADPALADIPVIILTARGQSAEAARGAALGAADYILKPFRPAALLERVRTLLC